jgi:hypothetical protein
VPYAIAMKDGSPFGLEAGFGRTGRTRPKVRPGTVMRIRLVAQPADIVARREDERHHPGKSAACAPSRTNKSFGAKVLGHEVGMLTQPITPAEHSASMAPHYSTTQH